MRRSEVRKRHGEDKVRKYGEEVRKRAEEPAEGARRLVLIWSVPDFSSSCKRQSPSHSRNSCVCKNAKHQILISKTQVVASAGKLFIPRKTFGQTLISVESLRLDPVDTPDV